MTKTVSKFLLSLIALFVAVAVGCIVYIFMNREDRLLTSEVLYISADEGLDISGTIVRDEKPLMKDAGKCYVPLVAAGSRVSAGQSVLAAFDSPEKAAAYTELGKVNAKSELINAICLSDAAADISQYNASIRQELDALAAFAGGFSTSKSLNATVSSLEDALIRKDYSSSMRDSAEAAANELSQARGVLRAILSDGASGYVTSPEASYYCSTADGWEKLFSPEKLLASTPEEYSALLAFSPETLTDENCCGKLINGGNWYLSALISSDELTYLTLNSSYRIAIAGETVQMTFVSFSESEDGKTALAVFMSRTQLPDVTISRSQSCMVVLNTYSGFRVPADGIHISGGDTGVYVLEGARAVFKKVNILYSGKNYYIVEADFENKNNLFSGDLIIIGEKDLFDGKMMK